MAHLNSRSLTSLLLHHPPIQGNSRKDFPTANIPLGIILSLPIQLSVACILHNDIEFSGYSSDVILFSMHRPHALCMTMYLFCLMPLNPSCFLIRSSSNAIGGNMITSPETETVSQINYLVEIITLRKGLQQHNKGLYSAILQVWVSKSKMHQY